MWIALWMLIGAIGLTLLIISIGVFKFRREIQKEDPDYLLNYVHKKANTGNVSLMIQYNDESYIEVNSNQMLPLASTVKIILALEFAQQAAEGIIDSKKEVNLKDLEKFYIPKTDGGSHEAWLSSLKEKKEVVSVPLSEVANGMIAYSSNANTEYLMDVLGLPNINEVFKRLGVLHHEPVYPIVSALYIPTQLKNEMGISKQEVLEIMKKMDMSEYCSRAISIHNSWINAPLTKKEKGDFIKILNRDFQKVWSDRLPRSTTSDYISILHKLNKKIYFHENVYQHLEPIMEQLMKNRTNQEWLFHAGQKGGSTAFIFTNAMYATDKEYNRTEIAFFANNLTMIEQAKLSRNISGFQLKFLTNRAFREQVKKC
ncbi:serine hydrolase [Bacillus sp. B1-b2]|uniref:serine hydrolase n=1 Tax=Bacillus sp. B1-b2 TaxID=2653201 RepID=UPI001D03043A|nr:serine hydrolase [Bacillus sp. B1-b2]